MDIYTLFQKAKELNDNLPKSEQWFWAKWKEAGMFEAGDLPNSPQFGFIPDIINRTHKYIIEVDGSIHDRADIKVKDAKKDRAFSARGYFVIRVTAYDDNSFNACVNKVLERRNSPPELWKRRVRKQRAHRSKRGLNCSGQRGALRKQIKELRKNKKKLTIDEIREISKLRNSNPDLKAMQKRVALAKRKNGGIIKP